MFGMTPQHHMVDINILERLNQNDKKWHENELHPKSCHHPRTLIRPFVGAFSPDII